MLTGARPLPASITQASYWLWVVLLASVYFSAAKVSLLLAIPPGYATAVWPPSGIAVAVLLMLGARFWPGVWLGAALANITVEGVLGGPALIATGNTLEALVGAALIRRMIGVPHSFERGEDVAKFFAVAVVCPVLAATIALLILAWSVRSPLRWTPALLLEIACFALLLLGASWVTFGTRSLNPYPVTFLVA